MAAWLPIIKVVLPYIGPVVQAALPHFTKKRSEKADPVVAQQIAELQDAVNANADAVKALAKAVEESARANDAVLRRARLLSAAAIAVAALALGFALAAWL